MGEQEDSLVRIARLESEQGHLKVKVDEIGCDVKAIDEKLGGLTGFVAGSIDNMGQGVIFEIHSLTSAVKRVLIRVDKHEEKISDHGERLQAAETKIVNLEERVTIVDQMQRDHLTQLLSRQSEGSGDKKWSALGNLFEALPAILDAARKYGPAIGWLAGGSTLAYEIVKRLS